MPLLFGVKSWTKALAQIDEDTGIRHREALTDPTAADQQSQFLVLRSRPEPSLGECGWTIIRIIEDIGNFRVVSG
jgi:hypothetical protein